MARNSLDRRTLLKGAAALGAAGLGAGALSACNGGAGAGGGGVLNVWGGVPNESGPDELCAAFMAENPDIKVTYTRYVNDEQGNLKLDTSLTGGVPIDMFFSYNPVNLFKRSDAGLALDLTDRIADDPDLATFTVDADPLGNYTLNGRQFCVPGAQAPQNVYLNKNMLDEAGITLGETWTVDEYVEIARELTKPGVFGTFEAPQLARPVLGPDHQYTDGGARSNFENEWFRKQLELAQQLQGEKVAMDQQTIIAEKLQTFSQTPFIAGRVAMLIQSGHITRYISNTKEYPHDFVTTCMPLPQPEAGTQPWNTGAIGDLMSISPKSQNQDAAWKLLKFWVLNAGKYMVKGGRLPSLPGEATEEEIVNQLLGPDRDSLYEVEAWQKFLYAPGPKLPVDTVFTAGSEILELTRRLTDETLLGDRTIDSWVTEMTTQADAAIARAS
ncbi:ABC transporter substrate-binding protein [Propionibacteriaceae bacterium Y2011]